MNIEKAILSVIEYKNFMEALPPIIKNHEKSMKDIADKLGLSVTAFRNKRIKNREWKMDELERMCPIIFEGEELEKNQKVLADYVSVIKVLSKTVKESRYKIGLIKAESGMGEMKWVMRSQNYLLWAPDEVLKVLSSLK